MGLMLLIVNLAGVIIGLAFIFLNIKFSRTLIGSMLKMYYRWLIIGAIFFTMGFGAEVLEIAEIYPDIFSFLHHTLLILSAIVFVVTSLKLPKEASNCLKSN
ncbi:hypothetical protein HY227_00165 [Candidatus Wolfebacteria bacterium]|nr:hypothetical protein [Candidatus Wolfebacteria bacterium]